jgi:cytochrome c553
MRKTTTALLLSSLLLTINLNADDKYSMSTIYDTMCIECHGTNGSGNTEKLTPSMMDLTQKEIEEALTDVENDNGHIIMEHNRGEMIKMGVHYPAKDMAKYMHKRFSKK